MTTSFSKLQVRLTDLSRRSEEVDEFWQTRVVELESTINETANGSRFLSQQNAELERRIAQQKPEMDNAIDARMASFRKLRNAYRVIVDLTDRMFDANGNPLTEAEFGEVIDDALAAEGSPSSSDSTKTIRGRGRDGNEPATKTTRSRPASRLEEPHTSTESPVSAGSSIADEPTTVSTNPSPGSSSLSIHSAELENPSSIEGPWKIQYSKIPGSSELSCGPVSPNRILKRLGGKKELLESLERLEWQDDFSLRVHIEGSLAFVYDPIFLEASSHTLLIDWGSDSVNEGTRKYIKQQKSPAFHTFVFPMQKNNWFYVGVHIWNMIDVLPTWPDLGTKSRNKIVKKLRVRCHENVDEQEISRRLDNKELSQFCVHISSTGQWERTQDFARKLGFEDRAVVRREPTPTT